MTNAKQKAQAVLETRAGVFAEYTRTQDDTAMGADDKRKRLEALDSRLTELTAEANALVSRAEAEAEQRAMESRVGAILNPNGARSDERGGWGGTDFRIPSAREYVEARALTTDPASAGLTVPKSVYDKFVVSLRKRSAVLASGVNLIPMDAGSMVIPVVRDDGAASVVAEGATIPMTDMQLSDAGFRAYKVAKMITITSELLEDSATDFRQSVSDALTRSVGATVDDLFLNGSGVKQPLGLLNTPGVSKRALGAAVTLDDVSDEMAAIEAEGGVPSAILVDPATFNVVRKLKASTAGTYHSSPFVAQDGPRQVWGANLIPAPRLAPGTVIVMDPTQVFTGLRSDVVLAFSDQVLFTEDKTVARVTSRWAGVGLSDIKAVRILTGTAGALQGAQTLSAEAAAPAPRKTAR
ncbi:hypothetical protein B4N89_09440 [Embleya scabrispora]|uniref:Phage capsid-like C-terminal domain-containing protein n=1 Tax=Embleya scabrispora TaxID=159449 RepID=A0A1T3NWJ0_9ACTN|nr:phage major capsid protein [Embleya scabrispora]OPC81144.1 hypothetical protein B4N89_09440 [Embleya scabrispora]